MQAAMNIQMPISYQCRNSTALVLLNRQESSLSGAGGGRCMGVAEGWVQPQSGAATTDRHLPRVRRHAGAPLPGPSPGVHL